MPDILSVQEAQERILSTLRAVEIQPAALGDCLGRILAEDIHAPWDLPAFDNSSMDGFAVRSGDVTGAAPERPVELQVVADIPAGAPSSILVASGQAARIMTGAPLPQGADAVVPVEDTNFAPGHAGQTPGSPPGERVRIYHGARAGVNVRPRGQDLRAGQRLLLAGQRLRAQDLGLLATIGLHTAPVFRRPRVGLFSSGDELVQPGQPAGPGQIYDSNRFMLAAILQRAGADIIYLGTSPDDPRQVEARLGRAKRESIDLIVTSAGVSVGAYDFVREVIEAHGSLAFWRVNMRPGKPLAFGSFEGIPLIGLPGNPVSAFVGCYVFAVPAVYQLAGQTQAMPRRERVTLAEPIESDGRESYLRAVVSYQDGRLSARTTGHQGSGNIYSLVQANALLIVPSGVKSLPSGSEVEIWYLNE